MKSILTFSQFITEEAEGITPAQKAALDAAEAEFKLKTAAELAAKAPAQAATTPVSTSPTPASSPAATPLPKLQPGTVITAEGRSPNESLALRLAESDYARKTQGQPSTRADGSTKRSQEGMTIIYTITGTIK
jgi:hypothetical protein